MSLRKYNVDYKSFELAAGVRHYFFLNSASKIFINSSFIYGFSNNSIIDVDPGTDLEIETSLNFAFGVGYKYNKYGIELRYLTNKGVLNYYAFWLSNYNTISLIFGYTLF
tara:strand:+ start:241 stop:570 length:330 start_codon:yes stop_codon:yes gene_type:complete